MTESLLFLFIAIGVTVVIAGLVVIVMVQTRRPPAGVREWIKESAQYWQDETNRTQAKQQVSGVKTGHLNQLLSEATPVVDPLSEVTELRQAASQWWDEQTAPRKKPPAPSLSPSDLQAAKKKLSERETGKKEAVFPVGAQPVLPKNLPPSFAPKVKRLPQSSTLTRQLPVFAPLATDAKSAVPKARWAKVHSDSEETPPDCAVETPARNTGGNLEDNNLAAQ